MTTPLRAMRANGPNQQGLRDLCAHLSPNTVAVEVGSYQGESAAIFMQSGKVSTLFCVDPWPEGEWEEAEKQFDLVAACYPGIQKIKEKSLNAVKRFKVQSLDFVYIDANHDYAHVRDDIYAWKKKVKAGGIIAGHDYHPTKFTGVVKAVVESFKAPTATFQDHSWMCRIPTNNFEIITYVSSAFAKALAITLPTWLVHSRAARVVIYTDGEQVEQETLAANPALGDFLPGGPFFDTSPRIEWRHHFKERSDSKVVSWSRKIDVLTHAYYRSPTKYFCWLDADVLATSSFKDAFYKMGPAHIGMTRMFNQTNRGRGEANAGVIFFQHHPALADFFATWKAREEELRKTAEAGLWSEQAAISQIAHQSFHGDHKYLVVPLSENLYNLEDDVTKNWLLRIERWKPKLIHMKSDRWHDPAMVQTIRKLADKIEVHYETRAKA